MADSEIEFKGPDGEWHYNPTTTAGGEVSEEDKPTVKEIATQIETFLKEHNAEPNPDVQGSVASYTRGGLEVNILRTRRNKSIFRVMRRTPEGRPIEGMNIFRESLPVFRTRWSFAYYGSPQEGQPYQWIREPEVAFPRAQQLIQGLPKAR